MRHANLAIFVPHGGCPHQCSFCNQQQISGTQTVPTGKSVAELCDQVSRSIPRQTQAEIAFFGGSFTALDMGYQEELLGAAFPFVKNGAFSGIRISTRPDYIDLKRLGLLHTYGVTSIELGAQSMDEEVLRLNGRGHSAADVEYAALMVKNAGFSLGLQMMTGLFGATRERDMETARKLADLRPETMRIYPTVVLEKTDLEKRYRDGNYIPQTLEDAVDLGADLLDFFLRRDIRVIRMGLHDEPSLRASRVAGPCHPAYRELCEGLLLARRIENSLSEAAPGTYRLSVSPAGVSKMLGHGAFAVEYLRRLGYNVIVGRDRALEGLNYRLESQTEEVDHAPAQFGNPGI